MYCIRNINTMNYNIINNVFNNQFFPKNVFTVIMTLVVFVLPDVTRNLESGM